MLGRTLFLYVAMAALSKANCAAEPATENDPFLPDDDYAKPIMNLDTNNDPRALRVPYAPVHVPAPVRIPGPPRNEDHTYTMYRPGRTEIPGWSTRLHQPTTSTEEHLETALAMTREPVSIPTVVITRPAPPLVWWTLPNPDQKSTAPSSTSSATLLKPTVVPSTAPKPTTTLESTTSLEPTVTLGPTTTAEPTVTSAPKGKPRISKGTIIAAIIGGLVFLGVLILVAWLLFRHYKRKRANAPGSRPTITHPFRRELPRASGRQSFSYFIPDTPSERRWGWSNEWRDAFRAWTRVPQRNCQVHDMDVISRPANTYTTQPVGTPSPLAGNYTPPVRIPGPLANTYTARPANTSHLSPNKYTTRPTNNSHLSPSTYPTRPANNAYLSPNMYTTRPVSNVCPSPYTESVYSQEGPGVRPDSGRPLGGNWL